MAENMPAYNPDALVWLEGHIDAWLADPAAIGLTAAQVAALEAEIITARASFTHAETIRAESLSATLGFQTDADRMRQSAARMIASVKAFANNQPEPMSVYTAASLSPRAPRSPLGPPEQPGNLRATLLTTGAVKLDWAGKGPSGTVYEVYRKRPGETTLDLLANVGAKKKTYTDKSLPPGTTSVQYQIRAIRGETVSPFSPAYTIQFGPGQATQGAEKATAA
jgi:hypothetical protein